MGPVELSVGDLDRSLEYWERSIGLHVLEREGGRVRGRRNAPRPIDVDILWIDGARSNDPRLQLPHPRMWHRAFVLAPLAEMAPELRQPGTDRTVRELLDTAIGRVRRLGPLGVPSVTDDAVR